MLRAGPSSHPALSYADNFAQSTSDMLLLVGRVLLAWLFVRYGFGKIFTLDAYAATLPPRGIPAWLVYVAVPVEFLGGLAIILGIATRYAAVLLMLFLIVATAASHRYWEFAPGPQLNAQTGNFFKNLSIFGGFVLLFVTGAGRFSLDYWLGRRA